jgi:tetratricopeptide (TPR) repeat protein
MVFMNAMEASSASNGAPTAPTSDLIKQLIEKGQHYIANKTPSQARILFVEAWNLARESGEDHYLVEVAQLMALIEPQKTQQDWIRKAIEVAESSSQENARQQLGNLYTSLAWKLFDLRQYEKALTTFERSLVHLREQNSVKEIFVARWSMGKVLRAMNRTEEALVIQKSLLSEIGSGGTPDGRVFEELAECLQALHKVAEAEPYFALAYKELSSNEWIADNQPLKLKRLKDLGKVKEKRG